MIAAPAPRGRGCFGGVVLRSSVSWRRPSRRACIAATWPRSHGAGSSAACRCSTSAGGHRCCRPSAVSRHHGAARQLLGAPAPRPDRPTCRTTRWRQGSRGGPRPRSPRGLGRGPRFERGHRAPWRRDRRSPPAAAPPPLRAAPPECHQERLVAHLLDPEEQRIFAIRRPPRPGCSLGATGPEAFRGPRSTCSPTAACEVRYRAARALADLRGTSTRDTPLRADEECRHSDARGVLLVSVERADFLWEGRRLLDDENRAGTMGLRRRTRAPAPARRTGGCRTWFVRVALVRPREPLRPRVPRPAGRTIPRSARDRARLPGVFRPLARARGAVKLCRFSSRGTVRRRVSVASAEVALATAPASSDAIRPFRHVIPRVCALPNCSWTREPPARRAAILQFFQAANTLRCPRPLPDPRRSGSRRPVVVAPALGVSSESDRVGKDPPLLQNLFDSSSGWSVSPSRIAGLRLSSARRRT
jgi:hypothetical protein